MSKLKFELNPSMLEPLCDRFVSEGYKDPVGEKEAFEQVCAMDEIEGIGFFCPGQINHDNAREYRDAILARGKQPGTLILNNWQREYGWGSFTNKDEKIRELSMESARTCKDLAEIMDMDAICIWFANDGVDYIFQADYFKAWDRLVKAVGELAEYKPNIKIAVEYKIREPRIHQFISNAGDAIALIDEVGSPNVGVALDLGHSLIAGERMAYAAARLLQKGRLFRMHWGDNYRMWDDDVIVGSVNTLEFIEVVYWLKKAGWCGWCDLDQYPFKNNASDAVLESIAWVRGFEALVDRIGISTLDRIIENDEPRAALKLVREAMFDFADA